MHERARWLDYRVKDRTGNTRNTTRAGVKKKREKTSTGQPRLFHSERDGGNLLSSSSFYFFSSPSPRLLHDISIFVNANGLRNFAVHPGGHHVCVFVFFSPSVLPSFFSSISSSSDRNAASFCFAKLIQPDSPAAFNQRDDLRFFFRRGWVSVNFIPSPQLLYPHTRFCGAVCVRFIAARSSL